MIVQYLKLNNIYGLQDFEINFTYPKKVLNSILEGEHLEGRERFRYKKAVVLMGANATGKTSLGRALLRIFSFIDEEGRVTVEAPEQDAGAHHFDLVSFPLSDLVGQVLLSGITDQLKALRADYKEYQKKGAGGNGNSPKD